MRDSAAIDCKMTVH